MSRNDPWVQYSTLFHAVSKYSYFETHPFSSQIAIKLGVSERSHKQQIGSDFGTKVADLFPTT